MRSALLYRSAHYRAVSLSGDGSAAVVHDDGTSFEATSQLLVPGKSGASEALTVRTRAGHLHTAVYEGLGFRG
jgi:hypothetical protein